MANIIGVRERFTHVVSAMGFNMLRAVMDLVENLPAVNPHTTLKDRLVLAHQLKLVLKATRCLQVVARGNQRPSEVLTSLPWSIARLVRSGQRSSGLPSPCT